jgi:hypothetical protein
MQGATVIALVCVALIVGCSSGDGSVDLGLAGDYQLVEFGVDSADDNPRAEGLKLRFEANGEVQVENDEGRYVNFDTFQAHGDGTVDFTNSTAIVSPGGDLLASGVLLDGEDIALRLALRTAWWAGASALDGWYTLCFVSSVGETGLCSTSLWAAHAAHSTMEWTVIADSGRARGDVGLWTFGIKDGNLKLDRYLGAVNADGSVFIATHEDAAGSSFLIGVRRDLTDDNKLLGDYVGYSFAAQGLECTTGRFTLSADGANAARTTVWSDGARDSESFAYKLSPEGYVLVDGMHFGALTYDGGFFVGVDTDESDGVIGLHVGIRK